MSERHVDPQYDEPCDCSLRGPSGFFLPHAPGAPGCEVNEDGSLREEAPDPRFPFAALPEELLWDDQTALAVDLAERELEQDEVERLAAKYARLKEEV